MERIAFIGLGVMGKPMAKNLCKAGYPLTVFDHKTAAMEELCKCGANAAVSPKDAAEKADIVITMLPNSPHVKDVVLGKDGALEGMRAGCLLIDMSSISPVASKEIAQLLAEKHCNMIDAPVSGGEPKAKDATLSIMAGGRTEDLEKAKKILLSMGNHVEHCGDVGAGNTVKLANQIVVALNIAAVSEALMMGKMAGVDPEVIFKAIRGGLAGSTVMDAKAPMMIADNFAPGFRVELHIKDLDNALDTAHLTGAPLPLTSQVMEILNWLKANGSGKDDHSAIVKYYEAVTNDTVAKTNA